MVGQGFSVRNAVSQRRWRRVQWWLPLYLTVALVVIFLRPPIPILSTRTLAVAWDMWAHHQFLVPHLNGVPYAEKAPLLYWMIDAGWAAFGVSDVWPRVLMVLIGAAQVILAQRLAVRLFPGETCVARYTPWLLVGFAFSFAFGLQVLFDGLLAIWVLAALLCLIPLPGHTAPRWVGLAICAGLGLLTKGPVLFVHVAPVWLLGPWWNRYAREHPSRWYGYGLVALIGAGLILAAWVIPAIAESGTAYAHDLVFRQTSGRMVNAFIHRHAFWWYVPWAIVLLFPFVAWPRVWAGLLACRPPSSPGLRMLLAWLIPAFVVFSAISGKQSYYLLPELPAAAIGMAALVDHLQRTGGRVARSVWLGPWPLAVMSFAVAVFVIALPFMVRAGQVQSHWLRDLASASAPFGVLYLAIGVSLLLPWRAELGRIALAGLLGTAGAYALFELAIVTPAFDMRPAAEVLASAAEHKHAIGNLGFYNSQFQFAARLTKPVVRLYPGRPLQDWAVRHPHGVVIAYPKRLTFDDLHYARLVQPYRGIWMVIWNAPTLAQLQRGASPPKPAATTRLLPTADYWRYADVH